ncbi:hypothetical protein MUN82_20260 [Hymenobacter aerilatus]|uniref:Uncharacterized protein n=1 Tax=Hymenobacter aerilatus TaxID=2932251 RepID=A0A8T9SWZ2_9BACT|nr:hypothetical protein [Hymenobacter aerilatus]UOR05253.1 hypothetical protein MUN82_20260 [Hymenobacter aerilatus]
MLAIDKCLYTSADAERCDCVLIIADQLHFIEFKTSETTRHANPGTCLDQLAASIRDFFDREIIQANETVYAYASVGFSKQIPQNGAHWRDQSVSLQQKIQQGASRPIRLRYCSESELQVK